MHINWTKNSIPDLSDKTAIITGANSGVGFETALELAKHGCNIIMGCRNVEKGQEAKKKILAVAPKANIFVEKIDLADFASIHTFCLEVLKKHSKISLLVNNAGVINIPYSKTKDGIETLFQTNYLGQFLLTSLLYPFLLMDPNARIVEVSSTVHKQGKIQFDNLQGEQGYSRLHAYPNSKLAGLMFSLELDRRIKSAHHNIISVAAHPGWAATELNAKASGFEKMFFSMVRLASQPAAVGALPIIYACVGKEVKGGELIGPDGIMEMHGQYPAFVKVAKQAKDEKIAKLLWEKSEEMVGNQFTIMNCYSPTHSQFSASPVIPAKAGISP